MNLESGAHVYSAANEKVGRVDRIVIDPRTKEVTQLVVRKGTLLKTDKILPLAYVASAAGDRVVLSASAPALESLPDYIEKHYVSADESELARQEEGVVERSEAPGPPSLQMPNLLWYPPAMGGFAIGQPSVYPLANARLTRVKQENIPADALALKEGAKVIDADGDHIGDIERIDVDPGSQMATHILIKGGRLFKTHKSVPVEWIDLVSKDEVCLAVDSRLLAGLPDYTE